MTMQNVQAPVSTPGIDALMGLYNLTEDTWDDNLMWFFAVAEVIWHRTAEEIPAEFQYRHSPVDDSETWRDDDVYAAMIDDEYAAGRVTDDDLLAFARFLNAVDDDFRARGENY